MPKYKNLYNQLNELNIADMVQSLQGGEVATGACGGQCADNGPIQADNNIGEFGSAPNTEHVEISKEEDGSVKIKTSSICVKLHPPVIACLKKFMEIEGEV